MCSDSLTRYPEDDLGYMTTSEAATRLLLGATFCCLLSCVARLEGLEGKAEPTTDEETASNAELPLPTLGSVLAPSLPSEMATASVDTGSSAPSVSPPVAAPASSPCGSGVLNSAGVCVPAVRCAPGTFRVDAGDSIACTACPSGMYSKTYDAQGCEPWTVCQPGQYVEYSGTSSSERVCAVCPEGETTVTENAGECTGTSDCPAGTYKSANDCLACSAGSYCSGKSEQEEVCGAGTWDNDGDPSTPCIAATDCITGQFIEEDATTTTDRSCSFCPTGFFGTETNAKSCQEWTTCVAPESFERAAPSATQDRTCEDCPSGQISPSDNAIACEAEAAVNLIGNANFETASTGWFSWAGGTVSTTTNKMRNGTRSLLVTGPGTGPAATLLDDVVVPGATYAVNFWVSVGRVGVAQVNITRSLTCSGVQGYLWLANHTAVSSTGWTQLVGSFSIPASCTTPKVTVYAEGGGANVDLYVDDVLVTRTQ